jgi:aminocarboxymuconate-semialdehyde decarboxylase
VFDRVARPTIDLHHHFVPRPLYRDLERRAGGQPRLVTDDLSITLNPLLQDLDAHLAVMDEAGVDGAVLTYAALSVLGTEACRTINDALAEAAALHPEVLHGAIHVDIDHPLEARAELVRGAEQLRLGALALPTSGRRILLDDPALDGLWEVADDLCLPILLHPLSLVAGSSTDYGLERSCARPYQTTVAAVRLLYGVLPRFAHLQVVAPHCGGTLPFLKGRLQMFFTPSGAGARALPRSQRELAEDGLDEVFDRLWGRIMVDTAGSGGWTPVTRMTLDVLAVDRVCFGSDFPLESHSAATMGELVDAVRSLDLGEADESAVLGGNAVRLLGLGPTDAQPRG